MHAVKNGVRIEIEDIKAGDYYRCIHSEHVVKVIRVEEKPDRVIFAVNSHHGHHDWGIHSFIEDFTKAEYMNSPLYKAINNTQD